MVEAAMTAGGIFRAIGEGQYQVAFPEQGIEFRVDYLRRERHELFCELSVACGILGARVIDGCLTIGTFNLSSPQARQTRARLLAERARARGIDWSNLLEEVCQRVLAAERTGNPSIVLREVPRPPAEAEFDILGLRFPKSHPAIVFGDGGTLKSYLALLIASTLAAQGIRVGYFDWELDQYTHRRRLEQITGPDMPDLRYVRCDKPLVYEATRLRRIIQQDRTEYAIFDSIGYGTQGAPESAEAAMDYCRALRQLGIGSLLVAHITKNDTGDQRPFGSVFWHNSARSTWNLKRAATSPDGQVISLAAFHRKANLGALRPALGIRVQFDGDRVTFEQIDVATIDEVAETLPLWQRIQAVVRSGPQTLAGIARELNYDKVESLDRIVRKHRNLFTKVTDADGIAKVALIERRAS
jgi:hypothetical protein